MADDQPKSEMESEVEDTSGARRLTAKEKKEQKSQSERSYRAKVRCLKAIACRLVVACADQDACLDDLTKIHSEFSASLKTVQDAFDEVVALSEGKIDRSVEESRDKIDDDAIVYFEKLQDALERVRSKLDSKSRIRKTVAVDPDDETDDQSMKRFFQSLVASQTISRLPVPEPEIFSGDPLKFPEWQNSFMTLIDSRGIPEDERIYYLRKYTSGDAKDCIQGFLSLCSPEAYEEGLALLKERFGSDFSLSNSYQEKLRKWPKVNNHDRKGLQKFSDYLNQVAVAKRSIHSLRFLDNDMENRILLLKLPEWCRQRWSRKVSEIKKRTLNYPTFEVFAEFVKDESDIVNDPVTCPESQSSLQSSSSKHKATSHSVSQAEKTSSCRLCGGSHSLQKCDKFAGLSYQDRCNHVRENRLCFGCLRYGHKSSDCKNRHRCETCSRRHPTLLHDPNWEKKDFAKTEETAKPEKDTKTTEKQREEPAVSNAVSTESFEQEKSSMVVPVWLSHPKDPNVKRLVYALLDSQSHIVYPRSYA